MVVRWRCGGEGGRNTGIKVAVQKINCTVFFFFYTVNPVRHYWRAEILQIAHRIYCRYCTVEVYCVVLGHSNTAVDWPLLLSVEVTVILIPKY